jgi:hypothetical protein
MAEDRDSVLRDVPAVDDVNERAAYEEWIAKLDLVRSVLEKLDDVALARLERIGAALRGEPVPEDASATGPSARPGTCPTCEATWAATGVASVVRGLATLDDVVGTTRARLLDARRDLDSARARLATPRDALAEAVAGDNRAEREAERSAR